MYRVSLLLLRRENSHKNNLAQEARGPKHFLDPESVLHAGQSWPARHAICMTIADGILRSLGHRTALFRLTP